jgi:ABC-type nitrate/sulfonate/bicarbonate transport system substrate-binding protein
MKEFQHRRQFIKRSASLAAGTVLGLPLLGSAWAQAATKIRYATGGGIGPNEMETVIYLEWMQKNVLQRYGKDYVVDMTFTRGTPEAASLLAAGQADMATLSFAAFATLVLKNAVPGGMTIVADNYQDGHEGYAANTFFVLQDSPIKTVSDLRGKRIGINAFGSAVDLALRVRLKKENMDPRKDVQIVEIAFPNIGPALREKRIDAGVLILPFMNNELQKGGLRKVFDGGDAFGPYSVIFHVVTNSFLKTNRKAVQGFLHDYVHGLKWFYDPANRKRAVEMTAEFTKTPAAVLDSYFMTSRDYYRDRDGCVSAEVIQRPVDAMHREGLIDKPVKIADYMDLSMLPGQCKK